MQVFARSALVAGLAVAVVAVANPAHPQADPQRCESAATPPDQRVATCDKAIAANARSDRAFTGRCAARSALGALDEAISDCDRAPEINPRNVEAFMLRGHAALRLARLDDALFHYDEALKLAPGRSEARFGRGVVLRRKGDAARGDAELAAARKAAPGIDATMAKLGIAP